MQQRQIGFVLLALSLVLGLVAFRFIGKIETNLGQQGCYENKGCKDLGATLNFSHLGIGIIFAFFSLSIYLLFFSRSEELLLKKLESEKDNLNREDKMKIIQVLLDPNEQKVFSAILEREGITQHLLRYRTDLSKAKLSQVLSSFEKKNLIRREPKGKTYSIYLTENI